MCEPMTIIGGMMSLAGTAMSAMQAQSAAKKAQNDQLQAYQRARAARQQEQARQDAMAREQHGHHDKTLEALGSESQKANHETEAKAFIDRTESLGDTIKEGEYLSTQNEGSEEAKASIAAYTAKGAAEARQRIANLAKLTAFNTVGSNNAITLADQNNKIDTIGGLRRGSLGVNGFEQQTAGMVPPRSPGTDWGGILSGVGGLAMRAGGSPGGLGGGAGQTIATPQTQFEWPQAYGVGRGGSSFT